MRLDEERARSLFGAARVARLATVDGQGQPHLVPVVFAVRGTVIVLAVDRKPKQSNDLRRLRNIRANPRVSLLADHYDENWSRLWWVRADGVATIRTGAEVVEPVDWLTAKYHQYLTRPPPGPVIWVDVSTWRGWAHVG
ncbi:TIGR03668 family PPOX class F420-dependent oxidoreductase [Actinophytocola sp. NPDC049390]|uniref:TIGR03668 family PPOX class F420-dependent oxidoreductase n=1 Tax=Actinophytocola sp. NPDC049390 TaxID=3363894 RepID=UPI0037A89DB7